MNEFTFGPMGDGSTTGGSASWGHAAKIVSYTHHYTPTRSAHHHDQHQSAEEVIVQHHCGSLMVQPASFQGGRRVSILPSPQKRSSRDKSNPQPKTTGFALAATHPSKYNQQVSQLMGPPPLPPTPRYTPEQTPPRQVVTPDRATPEPQWRTYTDPMWQTSSDPHYWSTNCTILKSDRCLETGNVVSPTWMIGLPCGGMVEMAHHYPSEERLQRAKSRDE